MYLLKPKFRSKQHSAGFSLLELVIVSASTAVLMGGLAASLSIASRSFNIANGHLAQNRKGQQTLAMIHSDLQSALTINELSANAVTMSVPDRNGDNVPETIRYAWAGTAGAPLTQSYNGGVETTLVRNVQNFSLAEQTRFIEGIASSLTLLFVSSQSSGGDGDGGPTLAEQLRIDAIETWGYDVQVILQGAAQAEFDTAIANANVIYVPGTISSAVLGTKLNSAAIGIVTESATHSEELHLSPNSTTVPMVQINLDNVSHTITSGFSSGPLTVLTSSQDLKLCGVSELFDIESLGHVFIGTEFPSLLVIEKGGTLFDNNPAAGRRVQLPWGDNAFDFTALNADGLTIMHRAISWATENTVESSGVALHGFTNGMPFLPQTKNTIDTPAGTNEGDLLIAVVATDGNTISSISAPAGWNILSVTQSEGEVTQGIWWKLAGPAEASSHEFTWSGIKSTYGWIMRFTGHDPTNPINASGTGNGKSSQPTCPSVSTTATNTLILRTGAFDDKDITVGSTGLSGHTTITMDKSNSLFSYSSGGAGYAAQNETGDTGTVDFILTANEQYCTATIAIAPNPNP